MTVSERLAAHRFVTDGGLETDLIFHHDVDLPEFAAYPLVADDVAAALLTEYYDGYARIAAAHPARGTRRGVTDLARQYRLGRQARARPGAPARGQRPRDRVPRRGRRSLA